MIHKIKKRTNYSLALLFILPYIHAAFDIDDNSSFDIIFSYQFSLRGVTYVGRYM